jgi:hypothetical protein
VRTATTNRPPRDPVALNAWLHAASTDDLRSAYPREWTGAQRQVADVVVRGDLEELATFSARAAAAAARPVEAHSRHELHRAVTAKVTERLIADALQQARTALVTGQVDGGARFTLINGRRVQRLLFESGLRRKPVPLAKFERTWPKISQRRLLMPLVQPKGIYCFYTAELVSGLTDLIAGRSCIEIAAGDGTLARFLDDAGTHVIATDDHSWSHAIAFGDDVVKVDAATALRRYQPQVVICSWPPAGNKFERHVFSTASVETYIVISTNVEQSAGNWGDYRRQHRFDMRIDPTLSQYVLPPELHPAVIVFERR